MEVLRFTASWCQPCKALAKQLDELGLSENITVVDIDDNPTLAQKHGIRSVPTLVVIENEKEVKRMVGVKAKDILVEWFPKIPDNENIIKSNN